MGYKCIVDGKNHDGSPVRVMTKVREVQYHHNNGTSIGFEPVIEVNCHPDNLTLLDGVIKLSEIKHIDQYIRRPRGFKHPAVPSEYDRDDA